MLQIEWSTANNPGGVLHSRLQRAVEMERLALLRSGRTSRSKRARSPSPIGGGLPKRPDVTKHERASSPEGRRRRSRSRDHDRDRGGRSRGGSKERGSSRDAREARDGTKSRDVGDDRRKDRDRMRASSKEREREGAREREGDRERDGASLRGGLREPDTKSRHWEDVIRATSRGCIAKLPRPFIEDARRVLYDVGECDVRADVELRHPGLCL